MSGFSEFRGSSDFGRYFDISEMSFFFLVWKALPFLQCSTTNIWYKEFFVRRLSENLAKVETSRPGTVVVGWTMVCLERARVKGSGMPFM